MEDEFDKGDGETIKIAGRDTRMYIGVIIEQLQIQDSLVLSCSDKHIDKMLHIVKLLEAVGIEVDVGFKDKSTNKVNIKREIMPNVKIRATGRIQDVRINKIGIIKIPDLFRFTAARKKAKKEDIIPSA